MPHLAVVAPLTGEVAAVGASAVAAARMALEDHGGTCALNVVDDHCDPVQGRAAVAALAADHRVVGVVGHYCSVVALAATPVYALAQLPLIVWGAHHVDITDHRPGPGIFRLCGTFRHEARAAAAWAARQGFTRIALLRDTTPYGREHASMMRAIWMARGGTIVGETEDARSVPAADALWIAAAPQAWWLAFRATAGTPAASRPTTASYLREVREAGWHGPVIGTAAAMIDTATLAEAGAAAHDVVALSEAHVPPALQGDGGAFAARYARTAIAPPLSPYARYAYAATRLMLTLLDAGATTRQALLMALTASNGQATAVGPADFDHHGQQQRVPIAAFAAAAGRWQCLGLAPATM